MPDTRLLALAAKWRTDAEGVNAMGYFQQAERIVDCATELEAVANAQNSDRDVLQAIMQAIGPERPRVDYTQVGNVLGLMADMDEALAILRGAGIVFLRTNRAERKAAEKLLNDTRSPYNESHD